MKNIGILLCDGTYPEIRDLWGGYESCFMDMLKDIAYPFTNYKIWHCLASEFPEDINEADIYIVSGSKYSAYDPFDWIAELKNFIVKADKYNKKLLGFCFGHQVIHEALGGKVALAPSGWGLGAYPIYIQEAFAELHKDDEIRILAMHQDQVLEPAKNFFTLGSSDFCPHAITRKTDTILTFQSHPEFHNQWFEMLCERIRPRVGADLIEEATATLKKQNNKKTILKAIRMFLDKPISV